MENSRKFKILFIAPYDYNSFSIRTLQTFIKSKGYNTGTIFFKDLIFNQLQKPTRKEKELLISLIKRYNPNIICISLRSPIAEIVAEITKLIKNKVPNSIVIWGGTHATICPEECIMHVDFVCVGEGEKSLLEFIEGVEQNKSVDKIKNFWVKKMGKLLKMSLGICLRILMSFLFLIFLLRISTILMMINCAKEIPYWKGVGIVL